MFYQSLNEFMVPGTDKKGKLFRTFFSKYLNKVLNIDKNV